MPHQALSLIFTFEPKNMGKFTSYMELELFGTYKIPVKLIGTALSSTEKKTLVGGTETLPEDFKPKRNFVSEDKIEATKKIKKSDRLIFTGADASGVTMPTLDGTGVSEKLDLYFATKNNKQKYNNFLVESRIKRAESAQQMRIRAHLDPKMENFYDKIPVPAFFANKDIDEDGKIGHLIHPYDPEFWFGVGNNGLTEPIYSLPDAKDPLYVTKPIGRYEPMISEVVEHWKPDPDKVYKKIFPAEPSSQAEIRDVTAELNGEKLQKIFAGPSVINFGSIYVKSRVSKYFAVRNENRGCIKVQLFFENDELKGSYQKPQIIPSGQTAGFQICFYSFNLQNFKGLVTYRINDIHDFKFMVEAQVDPVKLELETQQKKFTFSDTNLDMETSETIKIFNRGNAPGFFRWEVPTTGIFRVEPINGEVPAYGSTTVKITYTPSGTNFRGESEKLNMFVEDGDPQTLYCTGYVQEARCSFKSGPLDFGEIPVSEARTKFIYLKNNHKNPVIFHVSDKLPPWTKVEPRVGRIPGDGHQELKVTFQSNEEITINEPIVVNVRGGKQQKLDMSVRTIVPKVRIIEDEFDFGGVLLGSTATLRMTIINESAIPATLQVDLNQDETKGYDGIECLDIVPDKDFMGDDESSVVLSVGKESTINDDKLLEDNSFNESDDDDEPHKEEIKRIFNIAIKAKTTLHFLLKFTPDKVNKDYLFTLPIILLGYGQIDGLTRNVACRVIKPRCLIDPVVLDFQKKIISTFEKPAPAIQELTIVNLDKNKTITWKIDTKPLMEDKVFIINTTEGRIDPNLPAHIKVGFNPTNPGDYEKKLYFYVDGDYSKPYGEITLKGKGAYPRLTFDRREIILPVVPLDIESTCSFRIFNDGYENLTLKYIIPNDIGNIPIELHFPEGMNLGITKNKLRVEAIFKSKKPISFTTEIHFKDDANHVYPIKISGTADNCILTNFPYLERNFGDYMIRADDGRPIRIEEAGFEGSETSHHQANSVNFSAKTGSSKLDRHILGYNRIPQEMLDKSCQEIVNWLNYNVVVNYINKFPQDVIEADGSQIFEMIQYLTGKNIGSKAKLDSVKSRKEKISLIYKQYDDLIRTLKENGALLNHIRPEFLMKYNEYNAFIRTVPASHVSTNVAKLGEKNFTYLSTDAWITLFYQIMKIYYLGRVNSKSFRNIPGMPEKAVVPDYYLEQSNLVNISEVLLLRWLEIHYEQVRPAQPKRISNFDDDLKDCQVFAAAIQSYVGVNCSKAFQQMRANCNTEEDYLHNGGKILEAMNDIGLQTYLQPSDFARPRQRQMILYCLYLFNNLPHYIPKTTIEFSCIVRESIVKYIELSNPTNKPIYYRVRLEGSNDFVLENDEREGNIELQPKSVIKFPVKFNARVSSEVTGRIMFTNKRESNTHAAALVFNLKSNIKGMNSEKEWIIQSKLYENRSKEITVNNPFSHDAQFKIEIVPEKPKVDEEAEKKKKPQRGTRGTSLGKKKEPVPEEKPVQYNIPAFFCRQSTLTVKRNGYATLTIFFLPMALEIPKYYIIFRDERVGDIQHTLIGEVELPTPIDIPAPAPFYLEGDMTFTVMLQPFNPQIQKAKTLYLEKLNPVDKAKEKEKESLAKKTEKQSDFIVFDLEPRTNLISVPSQVSLVNYSKKIKDEKEKAKKAAGKKLDTSVDSKLDISMVSNFSSLGVPIEGNKITVQVNVKAPVSQLPVQFIMRNNQLNDIRVYETKITVLPKPVKAQLEIHCPARGVVEQGIPIYNTSDREVTLRPTWVLGENGQYFSGPREITVKKKSQADYKLTFKPDWICTAEAKLSIQNQYTGDVYEYEIKGFGEEPLAEDHIIMECKARKKKTQEILVKNYATDKFTVYRVETDLHNAAGPDTIRVRPGGVEKYKLEVTPVLGGVYTGSITFYDEEGKYIWYTVEIRTESPHPERKIPLVTQIRKAVAFDIGLENPLDERAEFEVILNGEGLIGEDTFTLLPKQSGTYELIFSPLRPMKEIGSIAFIHEKLGEVWYELELQADELPQVRLPTLKSELGKVASHYVELENPSNQDVKVRCKISNPNNFDIDPEEIIIPKYGSVEVQIRYMPSDLDVVETSEIVFETDEIGNWQFLAFGQGVPPTTFETQVIPGTLNKDSSATVNFKNPFKEPITVSVELRGEEEAMKVFEILLKKNKVTIGGLNIIQIPISFLPRAISDYNAEVVIHMNEKIKWVYPIRGVTESYSASGDFVIKTKCRVKKEQDLVINLPGNPTVDESEEYSLELSNIPKEIERVLGKWLIIKPVKNRIKSSLDNLIFNAQFSPLKPFKATVDLIIIKSTGGRWK